MTNKCTYCNRTFVHKRTLNDHIIKTHPDFAALVSRIVHECTKCSYKTLSISHWKQNMVKHPDIAERCIYCNKSFKRKLTLENHVVKRHPDSIASVSVKVHECTKCTYKTASASYLKKHITRHPDFIASVSSKVYECTKCTYKTVSTNHLKRHMGSHPARGGNRITNRCIHCNKTFVFKRTLDDHIVKRHPDFIASVSRKVHECTKCSFKTVSTNYLKRHMLRGHMAKHPDVAHKYITNRCIYCNKTFASTRSLNDHIVKTHPDFIASVKSKIHECTQCTYKTTISKRIREHLIAKHPEIADNHIFSRCIYCNNTFTCQRVLDDHIVKRHPDFIASVSRKVHECTKCAFKTVRPSRLKEHIKVKHPDRDGNRCIYCNKTFVQKQTLDDHIVKTHPDFIASVNSKIYECIQCTYKTTISKDIREHLMSKHHQIADNHIFIRCIYCNDTFVSKPSLDDHIVKRHPDFIASVSRKIHECTNCTFKTIRASRFKEHIKAKHPDIGNHISNRCIHCNKTFKTKQKLDDHIIKKHPDFIAFVTSKVHECTECTYKTTDNSHLKQHMAKHPDVAGNHIPNRCIHCNKAFTTKKRLDDHIIKKHPDFISSVSSKVHECTECTYKTTDNSNLEQHMAKHPDIAGNHIPNRCIHCNKAFTTKKRLDDHIIKKHPDFISSVSSKVHECTECTYKTTDNSNLKQHMLKHPDIAVTTKKRLDDHIIKKHPSVSKKIYQCSKCTFKTVSTKDLKRHIMARHPDIAGNRKFRRCIYCSKAFVRRETLDDHVIKTHPDFIASVSSRVHECTKCTFKTISSSQLRRHAVTHDIAGNRITIRCIYCNKIFTTKQRLDDHIIKAHPDFIASVSSKVHECTQCTYKTTDNSHLKQHMVKHADVADNHITNGCIYCNKTFKGTRSLDDHILRIHPDFIASVSSKVHECTECTYKTVFTGQLRRHMVNHSDLPGNHISNRCIHCNKIFTTKQRLDDHIIKSHPDFMASVTSKVHGCTECSFITTNNSHMKHHIAKHPAIAGNMTNRCIHCNKTFTTKQKLDEHILKTHPDFIASVSSKVHECTECTYKTTNNSHMKQHMVKHPDIAGNHITTRCIHCNKTFTTKQRLDDHIIKTHLDFIASVSSKVHNCTKCTYKTTSNSHLKRHMAKHSDIAGNRITIRCNYCNKTFTSTQALDDHILNSHPDFIVSVSSKIHECTKCSYKTTITTNLNRHNMTKHPEALSSKLVQH
nr:unnamed protein product [Callosobruchus analis]